MSALWEDVQLYSPPISPPPFKVWIGAYEGRNSRAWYNRKVAVWNKTCGYCRYCRTQLTFWRFEMDHFIPKARGGSNSLDNLVPACWGCNSRKSDCDPHVFLERIAA